jgi:hypothetical protein
MHTSGELTSDQFRVTVGGQRASVAELFPGFDEQTRVGVIVRDDFGAVGASNLLTAAVTGFYDIQRESFPDGFFRYVDYFLFHVDHIRGCHAMLDASFPDHKEVVVEDDPERILRAVNDRAITHLVVPEGQPRAADFHRETLNGAKHRMKSAFVYSPGGRVGDANIEIAGNEHVDFYVWATLKPADYCDRYEAEGGDPKVIAWERSRLGEVSDDAAEKMLADREQLKVSGRTVETFRRTSIDEALGLLSPNPAGDFI